MVFSSVIFIFAFLPTVLLGYYLINPRFKNIFLLISSLVFYAAGEPRFVFVMMGSIVVNHCFAMLIERQRKNTVLENYCGKKRPIKNTKKIVILMVCFNLVLFFIFKYLNFTISNINIIASYLNLPLLPQTTIALPIGISFFTFQAMSYVFDVYYGSSSAQRNPLNTALYISFFPQLIAGPIVRYQTIAAEIDRRAETVDDFVKGIQRFIIGLAKKSVIANTVALAADYAYNACKTGTLTTSLSWLGSIAYSFQILFDFSGYSDMAIGLGLMFGFHFPENFNYPYMAATITDFWRRWHISLGTWFRDYVYIPLGGSHVNRTRLVLNLLTVWGLTGIWHGANWTFIFWGLFYFVLLVFEKLTGLTKWLELHTFCAGVYRVFTLLCVMLGWTVFRAESIVEAKKYLAVMFGLTSNEYGNIESLWMWRQYSVILCIAFLCCFNWRFFVKKFELKYSTLSEAVSFVFYLTVAIIALGFTVSSSYNPFIYFNF